MIELLAYFFLLLFIVVTTPDVINPQKIGKIVKKDFREGRRKNRDET